MNGVNHQISQFYKHTQSNSTISISVEKKTTNLTAACWYLGEGETPGAMAHSHLPSLCFARPYAVARGFIYFTREKIDQVKMHINLISAMPTYISFRLLLKLSKFRFKTPTKKNNQNQYQFQLVQRTSQSLLVPTKAVKASNLGIRKITS